MKENKKKDMKNNKNKKRFHIPALTPLGMIIGVLVIAALVLIITIPALYITEYNKNKVTPFAEDLKDINKSDIVYGDKNSIEDFNFVLYCTDYNNTSGKVKFQAFAYENEKTREVINVSNQIDIKLGMYSDWIKVEKQSSSRKRYIASGPKVALSSSSRYVASFDIDVPTLPKKGNLLFINIKDIPVYAHVSYKTTIKGAEQTKHFVLKYTTKDYIIPKQTITDNRDMEYQVSSNNIQWRYKNDTSWTTLASTSVLTSIQARYSDGYIQWKTAADSTWYNLETNTISGDITKLNGYKPDTVPEVKIESNTIRYKFPDQTDFASIIATSTLQGIEVKVVDGNIVWRRWNQKDYKILKPLTELSGYTTDKIVEVRTSGSNVQWRYSGGSYINLQTINSLIGIEVKEDQGKLLWKCKDQTEWKVLVLSGKEVLVNEIDKNPATYGPTTGDFKK